MTTSTPYEEILTAYIKLFKSRVAKNEHQMLPYLHVFLGQALCDYNIKNDDADTQYYLQTSGYYTSASSTQTSIISNRINVFTYQDSGTGKGHIMNFIEDIFKTYRIPVIYADSSVNTQWLKGGNELVNNKLVWKPGALNIYKCLMWSEGEDIVNAKKQDYGNFSTALRSILDEPGRYTFGTRKDLTSDGSSPIYFTNCSLCTGAIDNSITMNKSILNNGTLQRFLIAYKSYNRKEFSEQRSTRDKLDGTTVYRKEKFDEIEDFCRLVKEIINKSRSKNAKLTNKISFNAKQLVDEFSPIRREEEEKILDMFTDGEKQKLMQAFLNRNVIIDKKIASQIALINCNENITFDDLKLGMNISLDSLRTIANMFSDKYIPTLSEDERTNLSMIYDAIRIMEKNNTAATQTHLIGVLARWTKGKWSLGRDATAEFIERMTKEGYLMKTDIKENNAKLYSIPSGV